MKKGASHGPCRYTDGSGRLAQGQPNGAAHAMRSFLSLLSKLLQREGSRGNLRRNGPAGFQGSGPSAAPFV